MLRLGGGAGPPTQRKKRKTVFLHEVFAQRPQEWRQVVKGKATAGSVGLREEMVEFLRAVSSAVPGRAMAAPSAGGNEGAA